jgi:hypothetical protein
VRRNRLRAVPIVGWIGRAFNNKSVLYRGLGPETGIPLALCKGN